MANLKRKLERLRSIRENNERASREVVEIWESVISKNLENLGKEKYVVLEQICIAALDCFKLGIAEQCIRELYDEFPNSTRVRILESMLYEADENYKSALQILNDIIKQDVNNSSARKRKVAIYKSLGKNAEAIKELTDYLKIFAADVECWQELSEMYINEHDYNKAAFCVEELILHNPHNHLLYQRYADVKYTQGGLENIELARTYYYQAFLLNPRNMRALYGIYLASTAIVNNTKNLSLKKKETTNKIIDWCLKEIKDKYTKKSTSDLEEKLAALEI
ncbi:unnamed protein product [Acanthoscelides obtectus]|uniref:ER membrane protein complex subunit 2 n=2 Tax=Acanthoscelides obtectus TaxID=200917 RepID=A0A9P0JQN8_ACAOB|nr:unnamed protein product [Acanthoscelides obtectus]CAK1640211.1 ER membrane protein complex subunit 2 [Acanthoscelides obtectus]